MEGILGRVIATLLGLLAVAAVVYLGDQSFTAAKVHDEAADIAMIVMNGRAAFQQNPNGYTNFDSVNDAAALCSGGIFPSAIVVGGCANPTYVDRWGNALTVSPYSGPVAMWQGSTRYAAYRPAFNGWGTIRRRAAIWPGARMLPAIMPLGAPSAYTMFSISLGGALLPPSACAKLVVALGGYLQMQVGSTTFTPTAPPDVVAAESACGGGTAISLTFQ